MGGRTDIYFNDSIPESHKILMKQLEFCLTEDMPLCL